MTVGNYAYHGEHLVLYIIVYSVVHLKPILYINCISIQIFFLKQGIQAISFTLYLNQKLSASCAVFAVDGYTLI